MNLKVADEVWIAAAELTRDYPERRYFSQAEIRDKVIRNNLFGRLRPGINIHTAQHCVADKIPNPGNYSMLISEPLGGPGRRLWQPADQLRNAPGRDGKNIPHISDIPVNLLDRVKELLDWYKNWAR